MGEIAPRKLDESAAGAAALAAPERPPLALKPLEELSEADIMQLTREDCRRYLKERGMRRPSWNKAEAIQQVLLLKGLFGSPSQDETASASKEKCKSVVPPAAQQQCALPEATLRPKSAQLTIFYSGVVNVFDNVSTETAQAIMLLAATKSPSPAEYPHAASHSCYYLNPAEPVQQQQQQLPQQEDTESYLPQSRSASLQRFFAKRRERFASSCLRFSPVTTVSPQEPIQATQQQQQQQ